MNSDNADVLVEEPGIAAVAATALELSIIVVTWNDGEVLAHCLRCLRESADAPTYEVIVVDNASCDDTRGIVAANLPSAEVVLTGENLGFGGAANRGAAYARGQLLLFMNPDAFLEDPHALSALVSAFRRHAPLAAAGPQLLNNDGTHQVGDAGYGLSLIAVFNHMLGLSRLSAAFKGRFITNRSLRRSEFVQVDWICGACMLVDRQLFDEIGAFRADLFLYGEDVEMNCRLRERGHRVGYFPQIHVRHIQGSSMRAWDDEDLYVSTKWLKNQRRLFREKGGWAAERSVQALQVVGFSGRWALYRWLSLTTNRSDYYRKRACAMARYTLFSMFNRD